MSDVEQNDHLSTKILDAVELLTRNWLLVIVPFVLITGFVTIKYLFARPVFTASTKILPADSDSSLQTSLGGLINLPSLKRSPGMTDAALFPRILTSRTIAKRVLKKKYRRSNRDEENSLYEIYRISETSENLRIESGIGLLLSIVKVAQERNTGMITVSVTTPDPVLSAELAQAFVEELNTLNLELRVKKARDSREFIEDRLGEVSEQLKQAEETLLSFNKRNVLRTSPELILQEGRLQRAVALQQQLYLTLSNQLEVAKIEEVKSTPVVQVLDRADPPTIKSGPPRRERVVQAAVFSPLFGIALVFGRDGIQRAFRNDPKKRTLDVLFPAIKKFRRS